MKLYPLCLIILMVQLTTSCRLFRSFYHTASNGGGGSSNDAAILGQAYDSIKRKLLNNVCVTGSPVIKGNATGEVSYEQNMTYDSLLNKMDNNLMGSGKMPLSQGSVTAKLAIESSSDQRSETHMIYWIGVNRKKVFESNTYALTSIGEEFVKNDKVHLQERCGNEFVAELQYGASIFATLKIEYLNTADKFLAGGSVNVDLGAGIIKVDANAEKLNQDLKKRTKVSLLVKQLGGDPTGLLRILPADAITCSMDDLAPCMEAFTNVVGYMQGDFKNALDYSADHQSAWNVLKYVTIPYESSGLETLTPSGGFTKVDTATELKRKNLEDRYATELFNANRAQFLLEAAGAGAYLSTNAAFWLQGIYDQANTNADTLQQALVRCQDFVEHCAALADTTLSTLPIYDTNLLSLDIGQKRAVGNLYYYNILGNYETGGKYDDSTLGDADAKIARIDLNALRQNNSAQALLTGIRLVYASGADVTHGDLQVGEVQSLDVSVDPVASFQVCTGSVNAAQYQHVTGIVVTTKGGKMVTSGDTMESKCTSIALPIDELFIGLAGSSGAVIDSLGVITRSFNH